MRIYVASSWRNERQPTAVDILRANNHEVYDFKHPAEGDDGFHWSDVMANYKKGSENSLADMDEYLSALESDIARKGFRRDFDAMNWADVCVLILPCGRSAHLEIGWMKGAGKPCCIVLDPDDENKVTPELIYKMVDAVVPDMYAMMGWVNHTEWRLQDRLKGKGKDS